VAITGVATASNLDAIGITALRNADPTLTGSGIAVIQAEANYGGTANECQVNPAVVNLSPSQFTYVSSTGVILNSSTYTSPNAAGSESPHADTVAGNFYGPSGAAPGVSTIDNYEADYYYNNLIATNTLPVSISPSLHNARIVNQSFVFDAQYSDIDEAYDTYAALHKVLFVSAIGNGPNSSPPVTNPGSPSSCYNGIAVACIDLSGTPTVGPTTDGRSKPDITAPGGATSYSTPYVSGCAAILMQAAARGDGGGGTQTNAGDIRTIKALLLNGATKPAGWTHTATQPLDLTYGAGEVNVFNSWNQLRAGDQAVSAGNMVSLGASDMPSTASNGRFLRGWDYAQLTSSSTQDAVDNYFVTLPGQASSSPYGPYTLTATLVWNRQAFQSQINNLDLSLYDVTTQSLVSISDSTVDNVQELYVSGLNPGNVYSMQVRKLGGQVVSNQETYSLAYNFAPVNGNLILGDANGDGTVNGADLNTVLSNFNQTGMDWVHGDFFGNGTDNGADLNAVLSNFNQHFASATTAVPEPGALMLLGSCGTFLLLVGWFRPRRRRS
jgi:hypothetical protein